MDYRDIDEGRRVFVARMAAVGIASFAGCATDVRPALAGPAPGDTYGVEVLEEPIVLRSGESLVDRTFVLSRAFRGASSNAIILVEGNGVSLRNVGILGADRWVPRWNDLSARAQSLPGVSGKTVGIRIENVRDAVVERVSIQGLPSAGISGCGIEGGLFQDISIRHCFVGINLRHDQPSTNVTITRVRAGDMWMGRPDNPSRSRPGGWIGGDGMALNSLRDSTITDCVVAGEYYGAAKITNPQRVTVRGFRGAGFQVQGVAKGDAGKTMEPARDVLLEDCVFDKGLGYGTAVADANCVQVTYHVASARIHNCVLNAAGQNGHGIQVTTDAHAQIDGCTIRGFNGVRGTRPAHALDVAHGSTVNADFARVNRFDDQKRIRLDRD